MRLNLDYLLEMVWEYLALVRVYTKKRGGELSCYPHQTSIKSIQCYPHPVNFPISLVLFSSHELSNLQYVILIQ